MISLDSYSKFESNYTQSIVCRCPRYSFLILYFTGIPCVSILIEKFKRQKETYVISHSSSPCALPLRVNNGPTVSCLFHLYAHTQRHVRCKHTRGSLLCVLVSVCFAHWQHADGPFCARPSGAATEHAIPGRTYPLVPAMVDT